MKKTLESTLELSSLEDNQLIQILNKYGRSLLSILAFLVVAIIFLYKLNSGKEVKAEYDYRDALQILQQMEKSPAEQNQTIDKISNILARNPSLHANFDGILAQELLINSQPQNAEPFVQSTLSRMSSDHFYTLFDKTSLLLAEGKYELALQHSKELQEELKQDQAHKLLAAINLLQIVFLEEKLNKIDKTSSDWHEFIQLINSNDPEINQLLTSFNFGSVDLISYLNAKGLKN